MVAVINMKAELARLRTLTGRTATTPEADRAGAFARLADYRDGGIFTAKFQGDSAWERHPNGDELVQIVAGATTIDLIAADERCTLALEAGMAVIVPRGAWHRFHAPDGVTLMTVTPQPTEHLKVEAEDPRTVSP